MVVQAYTYEVTEFSFKGESINTNYIKYIEIESMYEEKSMAAMYLTLQAPLEIYQSLVDAEKTEDGFINICIRAKNAYSETSVSENYISGRFVYILPSSNPDYSVNLSSDIDKSYKTMALSLIHKDYLDKLKTSLTGVYYNIDIQDLLRLALKGMSNIVAQAPTVEGLKKFDKVVIPSMNNMTKLVDYLFNLKPFYNTAYTFFADFNHLFLIAHDNETSAAIGSVNTVVFHISSVTDNEAYIEGVVPNAGTSNISGDTYHIYLNPAEINLTPNKSIDMISNQILSVGEDGNLTEPLTLGYGVLSVEDAEFSKLAMRRGPNVEVYANVLNSSAVTLELKKSYINGSLISPDKAIKVEFNLTDGKEDFNAKYSGDYYLVYKKEIVNNNSGVFSVSCAVGLRKIGELITVADNSTPGERGIYSSEGGGGSSTVHLGTRASSSAKSSANASKSGSTTSRISGGGGGHYVEAPRYSSNPYNLKSNKFTGPPAIDTKSSGAVKILKPHVTEPKV